MIIGVNGRINSGKSMVCQVLRNLADKYGKRVEIKSFAYPIYKIVSDLVGMPIGEIKNKKKNHTEVHLGDVTTNYRSIRICYVKRRPRCEMTRTWASASSREGRLLGPCAEYIFARALIRRLLCVREFFRF